MDKEQIKKENETKKEYLWSYKRIHEKAERAGLDVEEYRLSKLCPSVIQDGMPKGNDKGDLSDYIEMLEQLEDEYKKLKKEELSVRIKIRKKIESLENGNQIKILNLRYIELFDWEDIYKRTGYSKSRTHEIHSDALRHFEI